MIRLGFKQRYRVLHLMKEFGPVVYGGVWPHIEQQYRWRTADTGFVHYLDNPDFDLADYAGRDDVLIITKDDVGKLETLDFELLVVHLYELAVFVTPALLSRGRLAYVMHGIPTPEPIPRTHPFGGRYDIEQKVKYLCDQAGLIICLSKAEVVRLTRLYPEHAGKTTFIHGALPLSKVTIMRTPREHRTRLGFIGRMDYRKGLLQTLKVIRDLDIELHIACNTTDKPYLQRVNEYIEGAGIAARLHFHGFCVGERKRAFFEHVDAVIVPSLYEPFGYVVIEPVVAGTPVITANNGGMAEIIGDYSYQFDPYSLAEQSQAVHRFLTDPPATIADELGTLMANIRLACDGEKMVAAYRTLFNSLLAEPGFA